MNLDILVNKDNTLSNDFVPENLVDTKSRTINHLGDNHKVMIVAEVLNAFNQLREDSLKLGYDIDIDSGYRSYDYQQQILDYFINLDGDEAYKKVALPGASEHQSGLAIDFSLYINGEYTDDITDEQEETKWVHQNAHKYGFILRYPIAANNDPNTANEITGFKYEPWHIRYVGKELSAYLYENNLTLEEYHQLKLNKKL